MIDNLLGQGLGWLGYLERPAVLLQLLPKLVETLNTKWTCKTWSKLYFELLSMTMH